MSSHQQTIGPEDWPKEMRFLWGEPLTASQLGGLIARRGFYYQDLYSLRLMRELLNGVYDSYACEWVEDFLAWKRDSVGGIDRVLLVQVKTNAQSCFLTNSNAVKTVFDNFRKALQKIRNSSTVEIQCRLVYNSHSGHDCGLEGCRERACKSQAFTNFASLFHASAFDPVEFKSFLQIPFKKDDLLRELDFLPLELLRFFENTSNLRTFVRSLIGLIIPFHTARTSCSLVDPSNVGDFPLERLHHDRTSAIEKLRDAFETALQYIQNTSTRNLLLQNFVHARAKANNELLGAFPSESLTADQILGDPQIVLNGEDSEKSLSVIYALNDAREALLFKKDPLIRINLIAGDPQIVLERHISDRPTLIPIYRYLARTTTTHHAKVQLIVSFATAVTEWAKQGVVIKGFRAGDPIYREFYFVKKNLLQFVMGDLAMLELADHAETLWDCRWLAGSVLADALRCLYYGATHQHEITTSRHYCADWNDNVINDFASWIENHGVIKADRFLKLVQDLFADELNNSPLIFSNVDNKFIWDTIDAGIDSVAEAVSQAHPEYLAVDRGGWQSRVLYAGWSDAQIGMLSKDADPFTLYSYTPYVTRRWAKTRERDEHLAIQLGQEIPKPIAFIGAPVSVEAKTVISEVFGISPINKYDSWIGELIQKAQDQRKSEKFPSMLRWEQSRLRMLRQKLDELSTLIGEAEVMPYPSSSGQIMLQLHLEFRIIEDLLCRLGYGPKNRSSLNVEIVGHAKQRLIGELVKISEEDADITLVTIEPGDSSERNGQPETGGFRLFDRGASAVLKPEESLFREMEFSYKTGKLVPAIRAWEFLKPLIGNERPPFRFTAPTWDNVVKQISKGNPEDSWDLAGGILLKLQPNNGPATGCQVITGSPGTGKTRLTVSLALRFLEENKTRLYPYAPCRVLVAAASHKAVDNFVSTFRKMAVDRFHEECYVPYRFVTPASLKKSMTSEIIDGKLYDWSHSYYKEIASILPHLETRQVSFPSLRMHIEDLEAQFNSLEEELLSATAERTSILIPSHERWRVDHLAAKPWRSQGELLVRLEHLTQRKAALRRYSQIQPDPVKNERDDQFKQANLYALFSAPVVVTTVDAFDRLPDLWFDLVIVEETSQLWLIKLLKLLTRAIRARGSESSPPALILSGDPRQLPPFSESNDAGTEQMGQNQRPLYLSEEERQPFEKYESPFALICQRRQNQVQTLTTQYRMHSEIAKLVNSLFYRDQEWVTAHEDYGDGVWWIDTSKKNPRSDHDGTSRYNDVEIDIIQRLVKNDLANRDKILIITPYQAQVARLKSRLSRRYVDKIRTIDGCQGDEADTVIISFVAFTRLWRNVFNEFVVEPRRMNVALSRARESLYLVGNLAELKRGMKHQAQAEKFPHLLGLMCFFQKGGPLSDKVRPSAEFGI